MGINSCAHSGRRLNGSNWGIRNFLRQDRLINLESKQFLLIRRLAAETVDLTSTHSMNFTPMMGIFQPLSVKFANVHHPFKCRWLKYFYDIIEVHLLFLPVLFVVSGEVLEIHQLQRLHRVCHA